MADKGIIFSAPMVRALLDGRKTQTRRLIKPQPDWLPEVRETRHTSGGLELHWPIGGLGQQCGMPIQVPYATGDRLYVREAWVVTAKEDRLRPRDVEPAPAGVRYLADDAGPPVAGRLRSARFMPRWASRLTLTVTDVRVQRVAEISEDDAKAEGIIEYEPTMEDPAEFSYVDGGDIWNNAKSAFRALWNSLHTKPGERWEDNPWVVAVSFTVAHGNIDRSPE